MATAIDNICKIRDLFEEGSYSKILSALGIFRSTYSLVNRNIERFIKDDNHQIDFSANDLIEVAIECKSFLSRLNQRVNPVKMVGEIMKPDEITNETVRAFTFEYTDIFSMIGYLTEFHNIMSYTASLLKVLELQYEQGELGNALTMAIKQSLKG